MLTRRPQCPQGVKDDGDVNHFLYQGGRHRFDPTEHGRNHGETGQTHTGDNAFHRDPPGALIFDKSGLRVVMDVVYNHVPGGNGDVFHVNVEMNF